ncbi:MAG: 30S ribosome-binding factor RbfA [Micavibrio sp.]|nr:30S ribosome-binding factor RbfA [Micavibrio sp.]
MTKRRPTQTRKPPGQRQLRVGERIRHILAGVLRRGELHDPLLADAALITVTAVELGPDLKHATAYIMPLGGKNAPDIVEALNKASGYFRAQVAPELDMRFSPKISFRIDHSFEQASHIDQILRQDRVQRDLAAQDDDEDEQDA